MWGHSKKTAIYKLGSEPSPDTESASTLVLDFSASTNMRNFGCLLMLLNCGVGEDSWESLGLQGDPTSPFWRRSALGFLWREGLKLKLQYFGHLMQRVDSLEKTLMLGGVGGRRRRGQQRIRWLDGITDSMDVIWVNSGCWWWTGRPGVLRFMGSQRVGHDWVTELNWTEACKGNKVMRKHKTRRGYN